jgi:glycosyltransferase involved in cell wall biosynthesis
MSVPARKLRILHVIGQMSRGGAERQLMELCAGLDRSQYELSICSLTPAWEMFDAYALPDVRKVEIYKAPGADVGVIGRLADAMREGNYDIVHTWIFTANLWGRLAARVGGVPIVVSAVRSTMHDRDLLRIVIDQMLVLLSDIMIANSQEVARVDRSYKVAVPAYEIIWNGIDTNRYIPMQQKNRAEIRRRLSIPTTVPVVGTVGRLSAEKDYQTWIRTASNIKHVFSNTWFVIAGQGPQYHNIIQWLEEAQLSECTLLITDRADMEYILPAMDIFLFTSLHEGLPNVLLEAMACGVPVVSTSVGGVPEIILDGVTGFLTPAGDDQRLAEKVCRLLEDPALAHQMGQVGREGTVEQFSVGKMVQSYHDLYQRLARQKHIL